MLLSIGSANTKMTEVKKFNLRLTYCVFQCEAALSGCMLCAAVTVSGAGQVKFCRAGQCMGTVQFLAWRGQPSLQRSSPAPLLPFILNLPHCSIGNQ